MGRRRENDSSHEARLGELGRAFATALPAADEIAAELAIRDALDADLSTAEIDDENRLEADVICLSTTMPGGGDQVLIAIHDIQQLRPAAGFVVGGPGLGSRVRPQPGIEVGRRVSDAVEAVDAVVKRAGMNWCRRST